MCIRDRHHTPHTPKTSFRKPVSKNWFSKNGFPKTRFPKTGFPKTGFPKTGFPKTGFQKPVSKNRFSKNGFPKTGFPKTGFSKNVFPKSHLFQLCLKSLGIIFLTQMTVVCPSGEGPGFFPKQRLRWRVLYIVSLGQVSTAPDPKSVAQDSRPPESRPPDPKEYCSRSKIGCPRQ